MYKKMCYICFIDCTKAFDRVKHVKMIECLSVIGINDEDLQIINKLFWEQSASVRTDGSGMTSEFKIKKEYDRTVYYLHIYSIYTLRRYSER